ncbi:ABC transporter substrate-binding protein [Legionella feeleii]|uniref:Oligopeptide-binding protein AppA n=1 Tax=Legionella feeleii TaxID=453 RepID=A0A0W0TGZ6_9GAMM|nr:ABC transporter substrate-binding protein [Legionella feeleii]KTC94846.1 Oligopeptide-binding protein AppA precursor [Legionella feeleii]SPX62071.1 Oligopeptide-binding protein AppA precursor [Legionella feeleii]
MKIKIFLIVFPFFLASHQLFSKSSNRELNVTLRSSEITLDPGGVQDSQSMLISHQINCQLVTTDSSKLIYDVAESIMYISPLAIMIRIKPTSKFHDNTPITSDDVIASFEYIKKSKTVFNSFFSLIKDIRKINDNKIVFILKKENPQFLKILSSSIYPIFKKDFIAEAAKNKILWNFPMGCGKYKISQFEKNIIKIVPIKDKGLPINFHIIKENQISSNDLDKFDIITVSVVGDTYNIAKNFDTIEIFHPKQFYIGLNVNSKRWKNKKERCAFLTQLDFSKIIKLHRSEITKATDLLPNGTLGYSDNGQYLKKLKENAKRSVASESKNPLCISYLTVSIQDEYKQGILEPVKQYFPNIYEKPINNVNKFGGKFLEYNCDVIFFSLVSTYFDGYEFLTIFENNGANFTGINDRNLFEKLTKSQEAYSPKKMALIYRELINDIANYCVIRPIFTYPFTKALIRKNLKAPRIGLSPLYQYDFGNIS